MLHFSVQYPSRWTTDDKTLHIDYDISVLWNRLPSNWLSFRSCHGLDFVSNSTLDCGLKYIFSQLGYVGEFHMDGEQYVEITITDRNALFVIRGRYDDHLTMIIGNDGAITVILDEIQKSIVCPTNNGSEPQFNTAIINIVNFLREHNIIMN